MDYSGRFPVLIEDLDKQKKKVGLLIEINNLLYYQRTNKRKNHWKFSWKGY
jgi:hypothetical protein